MTDLYSAIQRGAHAGALGHGSSAHPTPAQLQAGNYRKGRLQLHGLPIAIETPKGQHRIGKQDGKPWSVVMQAHYGDITGTRGADGDPVDVFVGPVPESTRVYVVNQNSRGGGFDEHKVMLGFTDEDSARQAYLGSYERGWQGLGSIIGATLGQFRWWLKYGDHSIPFSAAALPFDSENDMSTISWDSAAMPIEDNLAGLIYSLRRADDADLLLDACTIADIMDDADGIEALDAMVVISSKLQIKMEQLQRIMDSAGDKVKPIALQVTEPFKQRGTTNICAVYELSDGQSVAIWFHNPDATPDRILPTDELVSWKWMLNKMDITILVAPEKGLDLNPREVARRIMRLAEKNSARFQKANEGRAQRMQAIEDSRQQVASKEHELQALEAEIEDLTTQVQAKRNTQAVQPGDEQGAVDTSGRTPGQFDPLSPEGYAQVLADDRLQRAHQDALDSFFGGRIVAVRNALRDLGWGGPLRTIELTKVVDGSYHSVRHQPRNVGAGANVVAVTWLVDDGTTKLLDDLTLTPEQLASQLNASVETEAVPEPTAETPATPLLLNDVARAALPEGFTVVESTPVQFRAVRGDGQGLELRVSANGRFLMLYRVDAQGLDKLNVAPWQPEQFAQVVPPLVAKGVAALPAVPETVAVQPDPAAVVSDEMEAARALLQSVIDGNEDMTDPTLAQTLTQVYEQIQGNADLLNLFEQAAEAYSAAVVAKATAA
ncbi:defense against restriction DarA-related protein [Pseudomonas oryzihabitans]|uniref:defense against restriction DarA-related protein n=1 Tax=Pseudomonas oryzihabitans TaxID=47885 RepID=UPI0028B154DA|nr:hypothetical protein [Pseudomonas oryzihabitans]